MALEDPEIQKGLLATILALAGGVLWWVKRRVGLVDDINKRVTDIERDYVTRTYLDRKVDDLSSEIRAGHTSIHARVDDIYRDMPKRQGER